MLVLYCLTYIFLYCPSDIRNIRIFGALEDLMRCDVIQYGEFFFISSGGFPSVEI